MRARLTMPGFGRWGVGLAWAALVAGLLATVSLWLETERASEERGKLLLVQRARVIEARLATRMSVYATALAGMAHAVRIAPGASRADWQRSALRADIAARAPGLVALLLLSTRGEDGGFAIDAADPPGAVGAMREGVSLLRDPALAEVLRRAARTGAPALSTLSRSPRGTSGYFFLALPILTDASARRHDLAAARDYVAGVIDPGELWPGLVSQDEFDGAVEVYDGATAQDRPPFFRTQALSTSDRPYLVSVPLNVQGNAWTMRLAPSRALQRAAAAGSSIAVLAVGAAVSLLLFFSLYWLASGQSRAVSLALQLGDAARARARRFSELARHAPLCVFIANRAGEFMFVNRRWREWSGCDEVSATGDGWLEGLHPDDRARVAAAWRSAVQSGAPFHEEFRLVARDGRERYVACSTVPERDERGEIVAYIGTSVDITPRREAELALRRANEELEARVRERTVELERLNADLSHEIEERRRAERERGEVLQRQSALLRSIPDMAWLMDRELRFLAVNDHTAAQLGAKEEAILGRTVYDFVPVEVADGYRREDREVLDGKRLRLDVAGRYRADAWYEVVKTPVLDEAGRVIGVAGLARDITERKRNEEALRRSNAQLEALVAELGQRAKARAALNELGGLLGVCNTLEEGFNAIVRHVASVFPHGAGCIYWFAEADGEGRNVASWGGEVVTGAMLRATECWALRRGQPHHLEGASPGVACDHLYQVPEGGSVCVPIAVRGRLLALLYWQGARLEEGADAAREAEQELTWRNWAVAVSEYLALALANLILRQTLESQVRRDPLTDLYNRRYMEEALERELRRAERSRRPMGLVMMDLDHFKQYNDSFGHHAGDLLLVALAGCLRNQVRAADIVCRYGGEEFLLILPEAAVDLVLQRCERLRTTVAEQMAELHGRERDSAAACAVTISMGIAVYPEHGTTATELIRAADAALYRAKHGGRNRVEVAGSDGTQLPEAI